MSWISLAFSGESLGVRFAFPFSSFFILLGYFSFFYTAVETYSRGSAPIPSVGVPFYSTWYVALEEVRPSPMRVSGDYGRSFSLGISYFVVSDTSSADASMSYLKVDAYSFAEGSDPVGS